MPRKHTKFQTCERHAWVSNERRERRAQVFMEGGPGDTYPEPSRCRGGECRIWPGTDLFVADICHREYELAAGCDGSTPTIAHGILPETPSSGGD